MQEPFFSIFTLTCLKILVYVTPNEDIEKRFTKLKEKFCNNIVVDVNPYTDISSSFQVPSRFSCS